MKEQDRYDLLWIRDEFIFSPTGLEKKVIFGHTPFARPMVKSDKIGWIRGGLWRGTCITGNRDPGRNIHPVLQACIGFLKRITSMPKDYYRILEIPKDATSFEIKKTYRRLALQYHPDRNPEDQALEHFKEITEAYGVLIDPDKRRKYDMQRSFSFNRESVFEDILSKSEFRDVFDDLPIKREWIDRILNVSKVFAYEAFVVGGTPGAILRRSMVRLASQGLNRMFHAVMDMHEKVSIPSSLVSGDTSPWSTGRAS